MIILPHELTTQEIRILQEFRRLNLESMTPEQITAIKHPFGGGEGPAAGLVGKGFLSAGPSGFTLTETSRAFLAVDARPMFEEVGSAAGSAPADVDLEEA